MSIGKEIRKKLMGESEIEENPLEIIGLSYHILELLEEGLSEEELYQVIRKNARNILAAVHPDRRGEDNLASRKFSQALSLINNRETFSIALRKFRLEKGWERHDKRLLRKKADEATSALQEEKKIKQQLEKEITQKRVLAKNGLNYIEELSLHLPSFTPIARKKTIKALYLNMVLSPPCVLSEKEYQKRIALIRAIYERVESKRKTIPEEEAKKIIKIIKESRLNSFFLPDLFAEPRLIPSIFWNEEIFFERLGFSKMKEPRKKKEDTFLSDVVISQPYYERAMKSLVKTFANMWVSDFTLAPVELKIEEGMIKKEKVIGSIDISVLADNLINTKHGIYIDNPLSAEIAPYLKKNKVIVVSPVFKKRGKSTYLFKPQYIFLE